MHSSQSKQKLSQLMTLQCKMKRLTWECCQLGNLVSTAAPLQTQLSLPQPCSVKGSSAVCCLHIHSVVVVVVIGMLRNIQNNLPPLTFFVGDHGTCKYSRNSHTTIQNSAAVSICFDSDQGFRFVSPSEFYNYSICEQRQQKKSLAVTSWNQNLPWLWHWVVMSKEQRIYMYLKVQWVNIFGGSIPIEILVQYGHNNDEDWNHVALA